MKFEIRDCRIDDLIAVTKIEDSSFEEPYPFRLFVSLLNDFPDGFRVAVLEGNRVIGYSILSFSNKRGTMIISSIAVDPKFRKAGVGYELLKDAIKIAKDVSSQTTVRRIELQVRATNSEALALYKKSGFQRCREMRDYYGPGKDAIEMELSLAEN